MMVVAEVIFKSSMEFCSLYDNVGDGDDDDDDNSSGDEGGCVW